MLDYFLASLQYKINLFFCHFCRRWCSSAMSISITFLCLLPFYLCFQIFCSCWIHFSSGFFMLFILNLNILAFFLSNHRSMRKINHLNNVSHVEIPTCGNHNFYSGVIPHVTKLLVVVSFLLLFIFYIVDSKVVQANDAFIISQMIFVVFSLSFYSYLCDYTVKNRL